MIVLSKLFPAMGFWLLIYSEAMTKISEASNEYLLCLQHFRFYSLCMYWAPPPLGSSRRELHLFLFKYFGTNDKKIKKSTINICSVICILVLSNFMGSTMAYKLTWYSIVQCQKNVNCHILRVLGTLIQIHDIFRSVSYRRKYFRLCCKYRCVKKLG